MRIDGQRRSDNFEDRGTGRAGGGGGVPIQLLFSIAHFLGWKGTLVAVAVCGVGWFLAPASVKSALLGAAGGSSGGGGASACEVHAQACDFSRAVLGSTEDVYQAAFAEKKLPGPVSGPYREPTLVIFSDAVSTGGCGNATSATGPFYCPADHRLYIDPTFYDVMERQLKAPGDFAQAYVIAHEVGHHVQNLIGTSARARPGETKNQTSVRVELQADCLAGVWGFSAKKTLQITDEDLAEALNAAHAIGDDALGHSNAKNFTHGTSEQRMRWFRKGFDTGDGRQCDTFAAAQL
jgi:predicted metalloprotease